MFITRALKCGGWSWCFEGRSYNCSNFGGFFDFGVLLAFLLWLGMLTWDIFVIVHIIWLRRSIVWHSCDGSLVVLYTPFLFFPFCIYLHAFISKSRGILDPFHFSVWLYLWMSPNLNFLFAVPGPPSNIKAISLDQISVLVSWMDPVNPNGQVWQKIIS